jgi:hypothetical protein
MPVMENAHERCFADAAFPEHDRMTPPRIECIAQLLDLRLPSGEESEFINGRARGKQVKNLTA